MFSFFNRFFVVQVEFGALRSSMAGRVLNWVSAEIYQHKRNDGLHMHILYIPKQVFLTIFFRYQYLFDFMPPVIRAYERDKVEWKNNNGQCVSFSTCQTYGDISCSNPEMDYIWQERIMRLFQNNKRKWEEVVELTKEAVIP